MLSSMALFRYWNTQPLNSGETFVPRNRFPQQNAPSAHRPRNRAEERAARYMNG